MRMPYAPAKPGAKAAKPAAPRRKRNRRHRSARDREMYPIFGAARPAAKTAMYPPRRIRMRRAVRMSSPTKPDVRAAQSKSPTIGGRIGPEAIVREDL